LRRRLKPIGSDSMIFAFKNGGKGDQKGKTLGTAKMSRQRKEKKLATGSGLEKTRADKPCRPGKRIAEVR